MNEENQKTEAASTTGDDPKTKMARRRAELVASAERRAAEAKLRQEELELEALEADERLASDGLERGVDYDVLLHARGVIVLRRKDSILYERVKKKGDKLTHTDELQFVTSCVDPADFGRVNGWLEEFPHLVAKCCSALLSLYEAKGAALEGKS